MAQRQITADDDWKYSFELPKFAADGHEIVYTVDEAPVKDYNKQIRGYDLINTYIGTPILPEDPDKTVLVSGRKTWDHGNNPEANRPGAIIVEVYADAKLVMQRQVTAEDAWEYAFELPQFAADGHEIVYTIAEGPVKDYSTQTNGYDLKNTYIGTPDTPDRPDRPNKPGGAAGQPGTGDTSNIEWWFTVMLISGIGLLVTLTLLAISRKKRYKPKYCKPRR